MYHNVPVDWKAFEFIFSGKTQSSFEQLAYTLFCFEFDQKVGIFRYFNQTGIETEPIVSNGAVIGFQAKYYEGTTKLSDKVSELCKMIDKSKQRNEDLTKIILYVNKEFSESSLKDSKAPKYQKKIESYARKNNVKIEWRVPSNIEQMLFSPSLPEYVRDFFFNPEKGIHQFIEQNILHSETVIDTIENSIQCNGEKIIIDRQDEKVTEFLNSEKANMLIYGNSGTGKSGLIKKIYTENQQKFPTFVYRSTDFGFKSLSEFSRQFGNCNIEEFLSAFDDSTLKILVIDSAEKIFSMSEKKTLESFLIRAIKNGWKIIHTIRTSFTEAYVNYILKEDNYQEYELELLSVNDLENLIKKCDVPSPKDNNLKDLLRNLFYLSIYINSYKEGKDDFKTRKLFMNYIWASKVKGLDHETEVNSINRENVVLEMCKTIFESNSYYYQCDDIKEIEILSMIKEDGLIDYDDIYKGYYFVHDIYEELTAQKLISHAFNTNKSEVQFFKNLDINMPMRKHFRLWLRYVPYDFDEQDFKRFILRSITNKLINKIWIDEILISLLEFEEENSSLNVLEELFIEDDNLLLRTLFLLNTACKVFDFDSAARLLTEKQIVSKVSNLYRYTKPSGSGWGFLIEYVYKNLDDLNWTTSLVKQTFEMIETWISKTKKGEITKYAGHIALYLFDLLETEEFKYKINKELKENVSKVILYSSFEIKDHLEEIVTSILDENELNYQHKYRCLAEILLEDFTSSIIPCQVIPDLVIKLCILVWTKRPVIMEQSERFYFYRGMDTVEEAFGLKSETNFDYNPTSALRTPILSLLRYSTKQTLDFITNFINECTLNFEKSDMNKKYQETFISKITFLDSTEIDQIGSSRLWLMHRGASAGPNLLECILMALEQYLLTNIPKMNKNESNDLCLYLLKNSKSIAITSVVTSAVLAFPDILFDTACCLISLGSDIFSLDIERLIHEDTSNSFRGFLGTGHHYDQERINSNNLEFRKKSFEEVIIDYQLWKEGSNDYPIERLYNCIDNLSNSVSSENTVLRYALNRIDLRKFKEKEDSETIIDGKKYYVAEVEEDDDLKLLREEREKEANERYRFLSVNVWAKAKYEHDEKNLVKYPEFEENPNKAYEEMKMINEDRSSTKNHDYLTTDTPYYIAAVLLKFYEPLLTPEQKKYCIDFLVSGLDLLTVPNQINNISYASMILVDCLPYLFRNCTSPKLKDKMVIAYTEALLLDTTSEKKVYEMFSKKMWDECPTEAQEIFQLYLSLKKDFDEWRLTGRETALKLYADKKNSWNNRLFQENSSVKEIDYLTLDHNSLMQTMMLLSIDSTRHWKMIKNLGPQVWSVLFRASSREDNKIELAYGLENYYISWLAKYIYHTSSEIRAELLLDIKPCISISKEFERFLSTILFEHDRFKKNLIFWEIWNGLYPTIVDLLSVKYNQKDHNDVNNVLSTYCFAWHYWKEGIKEWDGFKIQNLVFFDRMVDDLGFLPETLFSIAGFINTIGHPFIKEGVEWISKIISENNKLTASQLPTNTEYYLEEIVLSFSSEYEEEARKVDHFRNHLLRILNFLVSRGSTVGFLIREELF